MTPSTSIRSSMTPTQANAFRQARSSSVKDEEQVVNVREGLYPPSRAGKDGRSQSNASIFGPRTASLANSGAQPGSFSSDLKIINSGRSTASRPDISPYPSREDIRSEETTASEKRQAEFKDKIKKETKIKVGSENLLEALLAKNAKQTKDQRQKVESELSTSNRRIAEWKLQLEEEIERSKRPTTPGQSRLSSIFRGSPLKSPYQIESTPDVDRHEVQGALDAESPTYALTEILEALEEEGMQPDHYVSRANRLAELFKRHPTLKYDLAWSIFGLRIQTMLLSESRDVVAAGFRVLRYAISDRKSLQTIRALHTDSLVILSLVKESKATIEREQALKFVRAFLDVKEGSEELSNAVVRTLVSIAEHHELVADHHEDRLRSIAILTLAEIMVKDAALVVTAGGLAPLTHALGDGSYPGCESLVSVFLLMNDTPRLRRLLSSGRELEAPFAPFTDPLAIHSHEDRLKTNARSVATIINAWPGLFSLAKRGFVTVRSLLSSLLHPSPFARDLMLDLLFDVLHIKPPAWTSSFLAGRRLTTYGRVINLRANSTIPQSQLESEDDVNRVNLIDHYTALILAVLIECGLFQALSSLIQEAFDPSLKRKATLLLGEILKLADHALPSGLSAGVQILPTMMARSLSNDDDGSDEESTPSNMVYQVDSVTRTLFRSGAPTKSSEVSSLSRKDMGSVSKPLDVGNSKLSVDMDEIQFRSLLVETQIVSTVNFLKWKWDLINDIIEGPLRNPKRVDEAIKGTKFLKRLIGFYRPFKYRFSNIRNTKPNQRYVRAGCALMRCLLQTSEGVQYLSESKMLAQLAECLAQLDRMSGITSLYPLFGADRITETLTGGYFAILGTLTRDPQGLLMLGRWRMINMFYHIIDLKDREDLVQLLLGNMDFTIDSHLRVMLSKALTACPKAVRIYATTLLRKYATREIQATESQSVVPTVAYWAIRLLVTQLYDPDVEVSEVAVQILQEACNWKQYLEYVVKCRPALDHLGEIGAPLLLRFLSTSQGYQYLNGLDYITQEMDDWFLGRNEKYVTLVEASLSRAFSHASDRPGPAAEESVQRQQLGIVPPHFYRELTRTVEGCKLLRDSGHFEEFVSTIQDHWQEKDDAETMLRVKGSLWAVGNVGSMELGAPFLEESNTVSNIITIVERSEVMTMRGTAFFVLGLISRSLHGMEILAEHGWDAATDSLGQSRGYCLPPSLDVLCSVDEEASAHEAPQSKISLADLSSEVDDPLEARVISLIIDLGNTVLTKRAAGDLHGIKIKSPDLFKSVRLFRKIMLILECHDYRLPVRRHVIDMFDKDVMRQLVLEENSDDELESEPTTAKPTNMSQPKKG